MNTDGTWQSGRGGVQASSIYDGETYDARLDQSGWDRPGFTKAWPNAAERTETMAVEPTQAPPIRVLSTVRPKTLTQPKPGTYIFDLGQNLAGWAKLAVPRRARGPRSSCASARSSTRTARSTPPTCAPRCRPTPTRSRVTAPRPTSRASPTTASATSRSPGFPGTPTLDTIEGREVSSALPRYGTFSSSNPLVNSIQSAIRWGQSSNFLAVPTDASQRDERLGWTGDIQAFASTGAFNGDTQNYLDQWLQTLGDSQSGERRLPGRRAEDVLR